MTTIILISLALISVITAFLAIRNSLWAKVIVPLWIFSYVMIASIHYLQQGHAYKLNHVAPIGEFVVLKSSEGKDGYHYFYGFEVATEQYRLIARILSSREKKDLENQNKRARGTAGMLLMNDKKSREGETIYEKKLFRFKEMETPKK